MGPYRTDDVPSAQRVGRVLILLIALIAPLIAPTRAAAADPVETLTLDEAYARTKSRSSELKALDERIAEAEINVARAWALFKPVWNANFTYTHSWPRPPPLSFPSLPDFNTDAINNNCLDMPTQQQFIDCIAGLGAAIRGSNGKPPIILDFAREDTELFDTRVTWNVFNGRAIPTLKNAYDSVDLEKERTQSTELDLMMTVARTYYSALATQQAIAAAGRARDRAIEELAVVKRKAELGEGVHAQLVAAEIGARQASTDVRRASNAHAQALSAIALLTRSDAPFEVVAPPELPVRPEGDADTLKTNARTTREELRAAELAVVLAQRTEDEAWWRFAPSLSVFGGYRWSNVAGLSGQNEQWSVGVLATALLYDGGLRYQDIKSSQSRIRIAAEALDATRAKIDNDVDRALLRLEAAGMAIERANDAVLLAKEKREVTQRQYDVGAMRSIELKEANDAVLDSEIAVIRARMEEAVAILELQRAVGVYSPG